MKDSTTADDCADLEDALSAQDLPALIAVLAEMSTSEIIPALERLSLKERALVYRLLPKDRALEVFEGLDATLQGDLVQGLQDEDVAAVFAAMDPDDRVSLLDELPASVATRLLHGLPRAERDLTAAVLGYPHGSIGRRMSPEYVTTHPHLTAGESLDRVRARLADAETVYTLPVLDGQRRLVGVVSLRDLLGAASDTPVADLMQEPHSALVTEDAETAARRCAEQRLLALPIVDAERRLVGILTVDDALWVLEEADSEDQARIGGSEPLRRPYLSTPVGSIVRSRVVWLLVLAVGATLTVQVLEVFEETLEQMVVLSLFIPLLIGTGGNAGNQAATTITRALALEDVRPRDIFRVLAREVRVGLSLGLLLGTVGLVFATLAYGAPIGAVVGLTLLSICTMAAAVGGVMPLVARVVRADPAVFSNPFITTFVDATGLVIYFLIAMAVLQL
ncbi:magnesium transporter [Georgenia satyanarayanai]|uniref:magnesium transporter n=1 Tax=Georgenia satyanarayanai TaxID=860221 RepID=UPI001D01F9A1|nr:magnesium transporter [Georgenia satyanarayanai]